MARAFHSDRTWTFPVDAEDLWARIAAVDEFPRMWPWLRSFDARGGLKSGAHWTCEVFERIGVIKLFHTMETRKNL